MTNTNNNDILLALDLMCVSPLAQRRGVGQRLMDWGCEQADKFGVEAVVEASDEGKGLYARYGFEALRHVRLHEGSGRFGGREGQEFWWMVRPVAGRGEISAALREAADQSGRGREGGVGDSGKMKTSSSSS